MPEKQAIELLANVTAQIQATREQHLLILQAIETIQKLVEKSDA